MKRFAFITIILFCANVSWAQTAIDLQPDTLGEGVHYGTTVDLEGDFAVVGTGPGFIFPPIGPYVYLFQDKNGSWERVANLVATDSGNSFFYDVSLTVAGDRAYVMAGDLDNDEAGTNAGAAYIFEYNSSGGSWIQITKLTGEGAAQNQSELGTSVAIDGDYAIAGAPKKNISATPLNSNDGAAVIYKKDPGTGSWVFEQEITASDFRPDAQFGQAVGISGDRLIVGAHYADSLASTSNAGAAYIFERTANGWEEVQKLLPSVRSPLPSATDNFGWSVDINGDYAIVGAWSHVINGDNPTGMATIFEKKATGWEEVALLIPSDEIASGAFGWDVSIDANGNAAVAAHSSQEGGSAYVFKKEGNTWVEQAPKFNLNSGGTTSVEIDGDRLLFGAADISGGFSRLYTGIFTGGVGVEPMPETGSVFRVYPNPVADRLLIEGIEMETRGQLLSMDGRLIREEKLSSFSPWMNLENVRNGRYVLRLENQGHLENFRLIVAH